MMVFGDGALGRYLGLDEVTRMEPLKKGLVLLRKRKRLPRWLSGKESTCQ